jgi:GTP cyclohydrolase IA
MTDKISDVIRERVKAAGKPFKCNDNISEFLKPGEIELLQKEVEESFQNVLEGLVIDTENDHNTRDSAKRIAKMYCQEIFSGRFLPSPEVTEFPNATKYDQLYITGPIPVRSVCAHHFQNIAGSCWIGVFPGEQVIGLSKFNRIVEHICSRPQIQEELTVQIADEIEKITKAAGIAVVIKAEHHCMLARGVKAHDNDFTTSIVRGAFKTKSSLKEEFFTLLTTMRGIKD